MSYAKPLSAAQVERGAGSKVKEKKNEEEEEKEAEEPQEKESHMERFVDSLVQGARGRDALFSKSIRNDLNVLASAAPRIAPHSMEDESVDARRSSSTAGDGASTSAGARTSAEARRRLRASRRSRTRVPRKLRSLVIGWSLNWALLLGMLQLFLLYVCEFSSSNDSAFNSSYSRTGSPDW